MTGGVVADRLRPTVSLPFPKETRHTWQPWFARSPAAWRLILETTLSPADPEKTAEHRSVAAGQDVTVAPATACGRQLRYDNRATEKSSPHVLDASPPPPTPAARPAPP